MWNEEIECMSREDISELQLKKLQATVKRAFDKIPYYNEKYTNAMNHYSIGIELVGMGSQNDMSGYMSASEYKALDDSLKGFTDAQYEALKPLLEDICARYGIPIDRDHIIGHEEYSQKKKDPGELFEWERIIPQI